MSEFIDRGKFKKNEIILMGGKPVRILKRSWFTDTYGFYTYKAEHINNELDESVGTGL